MHKRKHIGVKRFDEMHELAESHYDFVALKEATVLPGGSSKSRFLKLLGLLRMIRGCSPCR